ncbi:probable integral membrane protein NMA1899 [plant metagenome]|uniref:Probable integral membrane protein NMA1899 n=1 Tax=plant metagenome TaxID=1297885 RepID=A0A484U879_9ZZZZ
MSNHRPTLTRYWLAETLRLREAHWGPLEDGDAVRQARAQGGSLRDRMLARADILADDSGLARTVADWRRGSLVALLVLLALTLLGGAAAAMGALGGGDRPVNVTWALGALLGLHVLTFLLWPVGLLLRSDGAWLGQAWLWASRKLARGPDAALAPQAFMTLLARHGGLRWWLGAITHGAWLLGLSAMLATLLAALSARRYTFAWETTILPPETFVRLAEMLGWLPARLGFPVPDAQAILASDGMQAVPAAVQAQWSGWLVGAVLVYGIAPRLLALLLCGVQLLRVRARLSLDPSLPGLAGLRDRLQPPTESLGVDAAAGEPALPRHTPRLTQPDDACNGPTLVGIELPADLPWPQLPPGMVDAGIIDTREQRHALLERLTRNPPTRLLLVCDARQTPDRGTLRLVVSLSGLAPRTRVWLRASDRAEDARVQGWEKQLQEAGLPDDDVTRDGHAALNWLLKGDSHE